MSDLKSGARKFKVGDRVRSFGGIWNINGGMVDLAEICEVLSVDTFPTLLIQSFHDGCKYQAHARQCRRLVKKERRRVWVHRTMVGVQMPNIEWGLCSSEDWVEFVEVKPKRSPTKS